MTNIERANNNGTAQGSVLKWRTGGENSSSGTNTVHHYTMRTGVPLPAQAGSKMWECFLVPEVCINTDTTPKEPEVIGR